MSTGLEEKTENKPEMLSGRIGKDQAAKEVKVKKEIKPRKGRKKKDVEPVNVPADEAEKAAVMITNVALKQPLKAIAKRLDPIVHQILGEKDYTAELSEGEQILWETSLTTVLQTADFAKFSKYMPWISLTVAAVATVLPRGLVIYQLRQMAKPSILKDDKKDGRGNK